MKKPYSKIVMGGSPTSDHNTTILWEPGVKTAILEQLSPTFAKFCFNKRTFSAGS
jgi:hypothetical protein